MKQMMCFVAALLMLSACQETLEERCAREARQYSQKNCPVPIGKNITIDSLTFDATTHTLCYSYTLSDVLDDSAAISHSQPRDALLQQLRNTTSLKPYKDAGYRFRYIYYSAKDKGRRLFETTFQEKDYK